MKSQLVLGIVIGLAMGCGGSYLAGQRYIITKESGAPQTKMDRWTGKTWVMRYSMDEQGKYVASYCWQQVGQPSEAPTSDTLLTEARRQLNSRLSQ
jgi:hypothetical protein